MKKMIILSLAGILGALILYFTLPYMRKPESPVGQLRIAIFTPTTHPALEEIEQGFTYTLQQLNTKSYAFTTFNANGNKTLLRAQAEELVSGNYDLIFTIGAGCSQTVAELLHKKGITTPHVFCAVDSREFAQSLQDSNKSTTGVYVKVDYKPEMDMLHKLKPDTKNIVLVYDPLHGTGLEKYKKEIEEYIKKYGITLHAVEVYQANEIQQKIAALIPTMDVVLVLTDNTVVSGIDAIIVLCNRYGVTLLASDLPSGKKGAALAYGITEYESGSSAAHIADTILVQGKNPHEIPIRAITNFRVEINRDTMKLQNVQLDEAVLKEYNQ